MIISPDRFSSLTDSGAASLRFAEWMEAVTREVNLNTPIEGTGSPEGVIIASPRQRYMDTSGAAGNVLYIKQTGVGNTGWVLV